MMAKFSVIVPIYNVETYLRKCVDSLLAQAYSSVEIILVDDGSPDGCGEICDAYAKQDTRVKVIHKENGGLVSARQAGCMAATGDYILNVDGDDWVTPDYFEKLDAVAQQYDPDCICFGLKHVYSDHELARPCSNVGFYNRQDIETKIFPILIENPYAKYFQSSLCTKAIKRDLYIASQMTVDRRIKIAEDHSCTKPVIYRCNSVVIVENCLYCYRFNEQSMTKNKKSFDWEGPELVGKHFEAQIPMEQYDFQDQVYRIVVHNLFNVAVSQFHRKEKYRDICRDVKAHLKQPYYKNAIKKCKYKSMNGRMAQIALRFRLYFLMKLKAKA